MLMAPLPSDRSRLVPAHPACTDYDPNPDPRKCGERHGERSWPPARYRRGATRASGGDAAQDQRGIGAAEAERIGQHRIDRALLRLVRHEIDRGLDRGVVEIERRRRDVVANGEHGEDRLDGAGGAQQMADGRLGRRHGELACGIAEQALHRAELDLVAHRRRGAVRIDVVDVARPRCRRA